uniref:tRNA-2-methylthio-N(6)-dimethylallyladenosine synthase n=1 Tax=Candidatus Methanogaster sp. ANME-2c ERB4 TaxID=2759911 RepID=A0A7G9YJ45_9EURY|nr:tRNA-2-methylthio-N(6)-dimethylallyladenosine synthase [Methanosarcinales archaeon ANME-2c ERB4]
MKIVIVSPDLYTYGAMVIGGVVRDAGFDVTLTKNPDDAVETDADAILLSLYSTLHLLDERIRNFVSISAARGDRLVYVGGPISAYPEIVLGELDVDAVIVGEGEESTVELLNNGVSEDISGIAFRSDGEIILTEPKPARIERPMPLIPDDIGSQSIRGANTYIETHRGCIGACGFCQVPKFFGTKIRSREIADIICEIEEFKRCGVRRIAISGGTCSLYQYGKSGSVNTGAFIELLQAIAGVMGPRNVSVPDIRVDYVNEEVLHAIHDFTMGWVYYGIESGSDEMLKVMRKGVDSEANVYAIELAQQCGVKVGGSFIVGYPAETTEDYEATKGLIEETFLDDVFVSIAEPIPGTHLSELVLKTDDSENPTFIAHAGEYKALKLTESEARCFDLTLHAQMCKAVPSILTDQLYQAVLSDARQQGGDVRLVTRLLQKYRG